MQVDKIETKGGHSYCWDKFWSGANGSLNKVARNKVTGKVKLVVWSKYNISEYLSVTKPFLVKHSSCL